MKPGLDGTKLTEGSMSMLQDGSWHHFSLVVSIANTDAWNLRILTARR